MVVSKVHRNSKKNLGLKRLRRTIVLRKILKKVKEWEILFPQLKDNTLPNSNGVNMLFQIKNSCPQVLISVVGFRSKN